MAVCTLLRQALKELDGLSDTELERVSDRIGFLIDSARRTLYPMNERAGSAEVNTCVMRESTAAVSSLAETLTGERLEEFAEVSLLVARGHALGRAELRTLLEVTIARTAASD